MTASTAIGARPMFERLVTYYGLGEDGKPAARRFLAYKIVAGPGPTENAGLAMITTLAVNNFPDGCEYCQKFHTVEQGGAAAALAAAMYYLDAHHSSDRVHKVESDLCHCG